MKIPCQGGCSCGAIRYECSAEPIVMMNCHCRACQYASGSSHSTGLMIPRAAFKLLQGEPRYYEKKADSGNTLRRAFCPDCGTPLFATSSGNDEILVIRSPSLDDPSVFKPQIDIFTDAAQAWDHLDPDTGKFPGMPPPG